MKFLLIVCAFASAVSATPAVEIAPRQSATNYPYYYSPDATETNFYTNAPTETTNFYTNAPYEPTNFYTNAPYATEPTNFYTNAPYATEPTNFYTNAPYSTEASTESNYASETVDPFYGNAPAGPPTAPDCATSPPAAPACGTSACSSGSTQFMVGMVSGSVSDLLSLLMQPIPQVAAG